MDVGRPGVSKWASATDAECGAYPVAESTDCTADSGREDDDDDDEDEYVGARNLDDGADASDEGVSSEEEGPGGVAGAATLAEAEAELDDDECDQEDCLAVDAVAPLDQTAQTVDGGAHDEEESSDSEVDGESDGGQSTGIKTDGEAIAAAMGVNDSNDLDTLPLAVVEDLLSMTAPETVSISRVQPRQKKKKKKRKKKRKASKDRRKVEEVPTKKDKRPPVPRFVHPAPAQRSGEASAPVAAPGPQALPAEPAAAAKEKLSKQLLLGRFPKKVAPLPDSSDDAAASAEELARSPVPKSTAARAPARSRSQDTSGLRPGGAGAAPPLAQTGRVRRTRSEHPDSNADTADDGALAVVGQRSHSRPPLRKPPAQDKEANKEADRDTLALSNLYFSFSSMKDASGGKVPLKNRDKVMGTLHQLNTKVAMPICRHFNLRYNFFSEHHCQAKKAGVTVKEPLILRKKKDDGTITEETRHLVTIRIRIRVHPTKGDPQTDFISEGTQLAILLHELCHLRHMNHGKEFMLFLRDIFAFARKLGVFDPDTMDNEIPSPWPWEREIFRTGGDVEEEELVRLFKQHRAEQRAKEAAARGGSVSPTGSSEQDGEGAQQAAQPQAGAEDGSSPAEAAVDAAARDDAGSPTEAPEPPAPPTADADVTAGCECCGPEGVHGAELPAPPPPYATPPPPPVVAERRRGSAEGGDAEGNAEASSPLRLKAAFRGLAACGDSSCAGGADCVAVSAIDRGSTGGDNAAAGSSHVFSGTRTAWEEAHYGGSTKDLFATVSADQFEPVKLPPIRGTSTPSLPSLPRQSPAFVRSSSVVPLPQIP